MRQLLLMACLFGAGSAGAGALLSEPKDAAFLPVDEAFELGPAEWRAGAVRIDWRIAPAHYLYRSRLAFRLAEPAGDRVTLGVPLLPDGEHHEDEFFGVQQVYRDQLEVTIPVTGEFGERLKFTVTYQGCADAGLCYPPQTRTLEAIR